jgi:DNA-binding beta-propeller fold protein YncE
MKQSLTWKHILFALVVLGTVVALGGVPEVAANPNLFVSGNSSSTVLEYNGTTGAFVGTFVPSGSGGLISPAGLVFGPNGDLFVSSFNTSSVLEYNGTTGAFVSTFASGGGLSSPFGLVFGPQAPSSVPEPATWLLFGSGLAGLAAWQRRKAA